MSKIINLTKKYGDKTVYNNFNLEIFDNEILAVMGNSGCGKTTLLNIIAGLTDYQGEINIKRDKISYIFQDDRLIPHLTVLQNLKLTSPDKDVKNALKEVGLSEYENAYPESLSTGMKRRVAILRAYLYDADIMLMDEPFRNLDLALKIKLMDFFKKLRINKPMTTIFVTHDVEEAVSLADRIAIISNGLYYYGKIGENKQLEYTKIREKLLNLKTE